MHFENSWENNYFCTGANTKVHASHYSKHCGYHYTYHLHNRAKFVKKTEVKCETDERMKQKFKDATTQQEWADALKASYQEQLRDSEKEKQRLSEELVTVIDDFEKCSISRNFASILES